MQPTDGKCPAPEPSARRSRFRRSLTRARRYDICLAAIDCLDRPRYHGPRVCLALDTCNAEPEYRLANRHCRALITTRVAREGANGNHSSRGAHPGDSVCAGDRSRPFTHNRRFSADRGPNHRSPQPPPAKWCWNTCVCSGPGFGLRPRRSLNSTRDDAHRSRGSRPAPHGECRGTFPTPPQRHRGVLDVRREQRPSGAAVRLFHTVLSAPPIRKFECFRLWVERKPRGVAIDGRLPGAARR